MCLAIPGRVEAIRAAQGVRMADVRFGGIRREACLEFLPEARVGDYVLVHVGIALSVVDEAEARRTYSLLREMGELAELEAAEPGEAGASRGPEAARRGGGT